MADVRPFRGIRYNPDRVPDLGSVTTPPYDVISAAEQADFYRRHPRSMIRLILNKRLDDDSETQNPHTRAAAEFAEWMSDGTLIRDPRRAYYLTSVAFRNDNRASVRYGLIARVAIEPFDKGVILPHEATYPAIKSERLGLMKACHANFSPIFSLFPDALELMEFLKRKTANRPPVNAFEDAAGNHHRLWLIEDADIQGRIHAAFADETLFIADGHHRYETALAYRDWVAQTTPGFSPDHPANFIMMYLSSMRDPGMIVLPAHRLVKGVGQPRLESLIERAAAFFDIEPLDVDTVKDSGWDSVGAAVDESACRIGVVMGEPHRFFLLKADAKTIGGRLSERMPASLTTLDVSILTHLLLTDLLGISTTDMENVGRIQYTSSADAAMDAVFEGSADVAFLLNPTRIEQVKRIAEEGLIMPRKTTYFAPKVITGLVLNSLMP